MAEDKSDKALSLIRFRGPSLPVDIAKHIGTDTLLASAVLSELVSNGRLKLSTLKVGGSPLYYIKGQEARLQEHTKHLHEKEQKAYNLLKEKQVLRDKELAPVERVALRSIKDFAVPLTVKANGKEDLVWKFHTVSNEEAEPLIRKILGIGAKKKEKLEEVQKRPEVKQETLVAEKRDKQEPKESIKEIKEEKTEKPKARAEPTDEFHISLIEFFSKNNIEVVDENVVRKKKEIDFILKIPSPVGTLMYYCKAKSKKRSNDADLSTAYVQGQAKKLPVLYLTTGELSKKANEMLQEEFKNLTVKKV